MSETDLRAKAEMTFEDWDTLELALYGKTGNTFQVDHAAKIDRAVMAIVARQVSAALAAVQQETTEAFKPWIRHAPGCPAAFRITLSEAERNAGWVTKDEPCSCGLLEQIRALRAPKAPRPEATRSASSQDSGWRPIETAPKDGTRVDVWCSSPDGVEQWRETDCWWNENRQTWDNFRGKWDVATHWMPLPSPPGGLVDHLQGEKSE